MDILAHWLIGILIVFAAIRLIVVLVNLLTRQWLRPHEVTAKTKVSILIPARNEEKNIGILLRNLVGIQTEAAAHHSSLSICEIIVYDDLSTDKTVKIAEEVNGFSGIKIIRGGELPVGWLGKNFACHKLAEAATGDWLLFLDADVQVSETLVRDAIGYAQKNSLRLLSIFPQQVIKTRGEWLVVPLMNWILLSLLPLILVRTCSWTSFAAANGQFMLFDAFIYKRFKWHSMVKSDPVEDIRISRIMKKRNFRTATLLSGGQISCRMYESYGQAINGFSKNIGQFFGNSLPLMVLFLTLTTFLPLFLILYLSLAPCALSLEPCALSLAPCALSLAPCALSLYFGLLLLIRIGTSLLSRQNPLTNILYWIPQQAVLVVLAMKSILYRFGRKIDWKGREI